MNDHTAREINSIEPLEQRTLLSISMVADLNTDRFYLNVGSAESVAAGDRLYFSLMSPTGGELFTTDGTAAGTRKIRSIGSWNPNPMAPLGNALVFGTPGKAGAPSSLWRTRGTRHTTQRLARVPGGFGSELLHDGKLYFTATALDQSNSLWVTDGTKKGTRRLADLPDRVDHMFAYGRRILLAMTDEAANRTHLWKSNGTPEGTKTFRYSVPQKLFNPRIHNGRLLFTDSNEAELLATDFKSIHNLGDIDQYIGPFGNNSEFEYLDRVGRDLLIIGENPDEELTLWKTDGTREATKLIEDLAGVDYRSFEDKPVRLGNAVFFAAHGLNETGHRLYKSDGTPEGTGEFIPSLTQVRKVEKRGSRIFFFATDTKTNKQNYYRSDGTPEGTVAIKAYTHSNDYNDVGIINGKYITGVPNDVGAIRAISISTGKAETIYRTKLTYSSNPYQLNTGHDGALYFATHNKRYYGDEDWNDISTGYGLWRRASSEEKPVRLGNLSGRVVHLEPARDVTFFTVWYTDDQEDTAHDTPEGDSHLYRTDGTPKGTYRLTDDSNALSSGYGPPHPIAAHVGNTMYFYATRKSPLYGDPDYPNDSETIGALWKSDGTKAGTVKIIDTKITGMTAAGDDLYFVDADGDLWTSDGTDKGTRRLMQRDATFGQFIPTSRGMYFTLETDHPGDTPTDIDLYFTDGTPTGTRHLGQFLEDLVGYSSRRDDPFEDNRGNLFFIANTKEYGPELWTTDGTPQGTRLLRDIRKGAEGSNPSSLITHDGLAWFFADDGKNGPQLWRSNGKPKGTRIVKNFHLDDGLRFNPHQALASLAGGIVYTKFTNSHEIWFGDEKKGFRLLGKSTVSPRSPLAWAYHDGKFVFAAHHPIYHTELWQADV